MPGILWDKTGWAGAGVLVHCWVWSRDGRPWSESVWGRHTVQVWHYCIQYRELTHSACTRARRASTLLFHSEAGAVKRPQRHTCSREPHVDFSTDHRSGDVWPFCVGYGPIHTQIACLVRRWCPCCNLLWSCVGFAATASFIGWAQEGPRYCRFASRSHYQRWATRTVRCIICLFSTMW